MKPLENETPVELAIRVKDLAEKRMKDCRDRPAVVDAVVKEQFVEVLPEEVEVWVKERKPRTTQEAGRLAETIDRPGRWSCGHHLRSKVLQEEYWYREVVIHVVSWGTWLQTIVVVVRR